eukprot:352033-Chlamydomonas_euryale.AAC.7
MSTCAPTTRPASSRASIGYTDQLTNSHAHSPPPPGLPAHAPQPLHVRGLRLGIPFGAAGARVRDARMSHVEAMRHDARQAAGVLCGRQPGAGGHGLHDGAACACARGRGGGEGA